MNYRIQGHQRIIVLRVTSQACRRDQNGYGYAGGYVTLEQVMYVHF